MKPYLDPREQAVRPCTPASVEQAKREAAHELVEADAQIRGFTARQLVVLDAQDVIERLAARVGGYRDLARLVRNLAAIHGEEL